MDIHRAARCGRNFEYYSEDGYLSGEMGAAEVRGVQSKGCIVTIKHFALNDQETNRYGVLVFANEQAIRELYLRGFETSVREGGAMGVMTAMNRVGPRWAGGDVGLMTATLRDEWGFKGFATTDQATFPTFNYCDIREGLAAGNDMWLNTGNLMNNEDVEQIDASTWQAVRQAAHRILYVYANSNAMNGISADATLHTGFPTWRWLVLAVTVLMVLFGWVWYKLCCLCFHRRTLWQVWRKKPVRGGLKAL